jgi:hypothetical protein
MLTTMLPLKAPKNVCFNSFFNGKVPLQKLKNNFDQAPSFCLTPIAMTLV